MTVNLTVSQSGDYFACGNGVQTTGHDPGDVGHPQAFTPRAPVATAIDEADGSVTVPRCQCRYGLHGVVVFGFGVSGGV